MHILTISPEYAARQLRWLIGAYKLAAHHGGFVYSISGLGRLDCALRSADGPLNSFVNGGCKVGEPADVINDYLCLSGLWTMGMYEALRTLNQKLTKEAELDKAHPATVDVNLLKKKFARVRMPLAKFESKKSIPTDYHYLSQFVNGTNGWGWVIADKTVIYRNDLADEVLELFDKFENTEISLLFQKQLAKQLVGPESHTA